MTKKETTTQNNNKSTKKDKGGRPTKEEEMKKRREEINKLIGYGVSKMNPDNIKKLGEAFAIGATIVQACDYADISPQTYDNWINKNPELLEYFKRMKEKLPLKAKSNIAASIHGHGTSGDINLSKWLVERKESAEYAETIKLGEAGEKEYKEDEDIVEELHAKLKANLLKRNRKRAEEEGEL